MRRTDWGEERLTEPAAADQRADAEGVVRERRHHPPLPPPNPPPPPPPRPGIRTAEDEDVDEVVTPVNF